MILLYKKQTRHKLIGRFKSYLSMIKWVKQNIKKSEMKYYDVKNNKL
jgi:hypothetical protein